MKLQLKLINGQDREVVIPSFPTVEYKQTFQNFLTHFKVNGSMIDIEGRGIPYHAVLEITQKEDGQDGTRRNDELGTESESATESIYAR